MSFEKGSFSRPEYHYSQGNESEAQLFDKRISCGWKAAVCIVALGIIVGGVCLTVTACISMVDNPPKRISLICPGSSLWVCLLVVMSSSVIIGVGGSGFRCMAMACGVSDQKANAIWANTSGVCTICLYIWMSVETWGKACTNAHLTNNPVYESLYLYWQVVTVLIGIVLLTACCVYCLRKS